ncbi:MAG: PaaI family thioesterase [Armatimonadota bacterium]
MLKDSDWCFACGQSNPHGLRLNDFNYDGDRYWVSFTPQRHHQGWSGVVHGGIVATLLDEVMTRMLWHEGTNAATAELNIRYHHPTPVGEELTATAHKVQRRHGVMSMEAEVETDDGTVLASARAKFMTPRDGDDG